MFIWHIIVHLLTYTELNWAERKRAQNASVEFHVLSTHTHGPGKAPPPQLVHLLSTLKPNNVQLASERWQNRSRHSIRGETAGKLLGGMPTIEITLMTKLVMGKKSDNPNKAFQEPYGSCMMKMRESMQSIRERKK